MCCVCAGTCNHVGNHSYCEAHGGQPDRGMSWTSNGTSHIPWGLITSGWVCPNCRLVWSPSVVRCPCSLQRERPKPRDRQIKRPKPKKKK